MKNPMNFRRAFFNFLFLSLISYTTLSIFYSAVSFNWTFQDWNINYDGGFVRRGLGGEFFSFINDIFLWGRPTTLFWCSH